MEIVTLQERPLAFTLEPLLSPDECAEHVTWAEGHGFRPASIIGASGVAFDKEVRDNDRLVIDDPDRAALLFERSRAHLPNIRGWGPTGFNERLRVYRYKKGQRFRAHRDAYYERADGERSLLTVLVYLNEGYEGGGTWFKGFRLAPRRGMALFFEHDQLHAGVAVERGVKYVVRSDVMYFPDWRGDGSAL